MSKRVKFGLAIPNRGPLIYPDKISPRLLLDLAEVGEDLGFDSVWVGDSILAKPRFESITTLAAIAARTERVRLGVACMASFPLRNPLATAHAWATLDQLSEGRTILVVCMGGDGQTGGDSLNEFKNFGIEYGKRAEILEENIEIIKLLWAKDNVDYYGKFYHLSNVSLQPKPAQKPRPPIWVVSSPFQYKVSEKIVRKGLGRVARLGDGWMTARVHPEQFKHGLEIIKEEAKKLGKSETITASLYYYINLSDNEERAFKESKDFLDKYYMANFDAATIEMWVAYGGREKCIQKIEQFVQAGADVITLRMTTTSQLDMVKRVAKEILPNF